MVPSDLSCDPFGKPQSHLSEPAVTKKTVETHQRVRFTYLQGKADVCSSWAPLTLVDAASLRLPAAHLPRKHFSTCDRLCEEQPASLRPASPLSARPARWPELHPLCVCYPARGICSHTSPPASAVARLRSRCAARRLCHLASRRGWTGPRLCSTSGLLRPPAASPWPPSGRPWTRSSRWQPGGERRTERGGQRSRRRSQVCPALPASCSWCWLDLRSRRWFVCLCGSSQCSGWCSHRSSCRFSCRRRARFSAPEEGSVSLL